MRVNGHNMEMCVKGLRQEGVDQINVAQDRNKWRTLVHVVMIFRLPENANKFRLVDELAACEEGLLLLEVS